MNALALQQEISNLLLLYPELAEDDQLRADMIEAETGAHEFLGMIVRQMGETNAKAESLAEYTELLGHRQLRYERRIEALRSLAFTIMQKAELQKIELPEATLSIRAVPPKVIIKDEDQLPDIACKIARMPDREKIKELLSEGPVAGAEMSNGGETLSIRTR